MPPLSWRIRSARSPTARDDAPAARPARRPTTLSRERRSGVQSRSTMRSILLGLGIVGACVVLLWAAGGERMVLPTPGPANYPVSQTDVDALCIETMKERPPDMSWVATGRGTGREGSVPMVLLRDLHLHSRPPMRVAGVLHVEFEWVALYPSRVVLDEQLWHAPWVRLESLWPDEAYWRTKGLSVSDRCAVVEGAYVSGAGGHFGRFSGTIDDVRRLDVWSTPHRPLPRPPMLESKD